MRTVYRWSPEYSPPFGLSDHCTVEMTSSQRAKEDLPSRATLLTRNKKYSSRQGLGGYLSTIDWPKVLNNSSIEEKYSMFHNLLQVGLDQCCPTKKVRKVSHLKQTDTRKWWAECRRLCGMSKSTSDLATVLLRGSAPTKDELTSIANNINNGFLEPQQGFSCLSPDFTVDTISYTEHVV